MKAVNTLLLIALAAGLAFAQTAKVVPVDTRTAAKLSQLKTLADAAQKSYDDAVVEAQHRLLTTREYKKSGQCHAYRENDDGQGNLAIGWSTGSIHITSPSEAVSYNCETADQKKERSKREDEYRAERAKWDADHPERYWLAGFCDGSVFTGDFKYLVPKEKPVYENPNKLPIVTW